MLPASARNRIQPVLICFPLLFDASAFALNALQQHMIAHVHDII